VGIFGEIGHFIMTPLYYAISLILVGWHKVFSTFLNADGGLAWVLSIVGLTLVIRAALIPLFVKQIKSSRNMQLIQPKVKELQKKYGHDRERLAQETMKLYKDTGTNPFASCLPILIQMPIFLALFRLVDHAAKAKQGNGFLTDTLAKSFGSAEIGGVIPISATFLKAHGDTSVQLLAAFLVIAMTATTFTTQRQLMSKNMPKDALTGPYAQQQKLLLYVLPVVFAVGGIAFPIGVLFYWTTSNLWTMGQQFYVIRNNPAPGTDAEKAKIERDRRKAERHGGTAAPSAATDTAVAPVEERRPAQRQQPKKQTRQQRRAAAPKPAPKPAKKPTNPTTKDEDAS
jgi:YidC/Oxa1 family membrane protein insertase